MANDESLSRRIAAEFIGTAMLVMAVVGSGIMAERLADGNAAVALLANTVATGAALFVLILMLAPISGAHFNPLVSLSSAINSEMSWTDVTVYAPAQITGGVIGGILANVMFGLPAILISTKTRTGAGQWLGEFVATFGLVAVVIGISRRQVTIAVASAVALYITAASWFTSSTSFANPAVTLARSLTDTFAGIRPVDTVAFIAAQSAGAVTATLLIDWLIPRRK